ncbi:MAG: hypothetical protein A3F94_03215 [Candidatus Spechtbacteria bacterium RIFCSPLOWO2_12_FULL_38_22]|uniref:Adenylosuccinate synthetase n=1 Tax=Candidatus Spechtbacteria bacterium RIFCSPLOWO2_12_FULL_38_22 TaxID=1802165 RepID=A0A1G2HIM5_9BACT|nr:MAG: hypothetical protein A3A00_00045 [Candidatus Spechtbacteria bacterium RIFCSPLOWO2_01_FULL_38_20]OGZ62337.1 MAG: hypothetical protein A3F94_03215 [Candidatus Spechtbacteria bacterium RIFCSPLOWO2_12_FULL_38_22]
MPLTIVVGAQWGDEGKGKITDLEASSGNYEYVVRYDGGNNAGHTVVNDLGEFKLHIVPSGILHPNIKNVIGPGTVVDALVLYGEELVGLQKAGITDYQLAISPKAHLVMPWHRLLDGIQEESRSSADKIGTTKRGMGPVRADKAARSGLRVGDLLRRDFYKLFIERYREKRQILESVYGCSQSVYLPILEQLYGLSEFTLLSVDDLFEYYMESAEEIKEFIRNTDDELRIALFSRGQGVLLEGAQGALLDLDHGTYPFVTSTSCGANGAFSGAGIAFNVVPSNEVRVIGVVKAYSTRVGTGPFPTFSKGNFDTLVREVGREFGSTTARPRMCAPIDIPLLRYASRLNGFSEIAITKLDVLSCLDKTIPIGFSYRCQRAPTCESCNHVECAFNGAEAVLGNLPVWNKGITEVRSREDLPDEAKLYVDFIERACDVSAKYISVGPERNQTIVV